MKKRILIVGMILIVIIILLGWVEKKTIIQKPDEIEISHLEMEDEIYNQEERIKEQREEEGLLFQKISLTKYNGMITFQADVTNQTGKATDLIEKQIKFFNKNQEEIGSIKISIDPMEIKKQTHIYTETTQNVIEATDFKIIN